MALQIPGFWNKFYAYGAATYVVGLGIPVFAVWWQQRKLKGG
jgi:hypothetical protein